MTDPIADVVGDYRAFAAQQSDRLLTRRIDITPFARSHLAFRVPEWDQYVHVRTQLERHAVANRETVWNGRPISLRASVELFEGQFEDGFHHVDDWVPQRLVTATGPNPLPR